MTSSILHSPLGKQSTYITEYQPDLLFPIPRKLNRDEIKITNDLPFKGCDVWNAYELSWLNAKGKPVVALGEFIFPCESTCIVESKSFKLYVNSFNNTKFDSIEFVAEAMQNDLSRASESDVKVKLIPLDQVKKENLISFSGINLDLQDISCDTYFVHPEFLKTNSNIVSEVLYSDLLKSNCLVTGQPDWASIQIEYTGREIDHAGLLQYLVSFRNHNEFHEQCVERIFVDIMHHCAPQKLTVYGRYTRRGGLDINSYRSTENTFPKNERLVRQ